MKYIYNYIEHSLNESFNSKEAKKKFLDKGLISKKDYAIIKKAFLPKYVYWGCREKVNPENKDIILDSIYDITLWFEKNKQYLKSKDIYFYSYDELRLLMNDPSIGPKKKKVKGKGNYEIIYEDDQGNIAVYVKDHAASVYWAHKYREGEIADGQWCTAAYIGDNNFNNYSSDGPIIIVISPNEKNYSNTRLCGVITSGTVDDLYYTIKDIKSNRVVGATKSFKAKVSINFKDYIFFDSTDSSTHSESLKRDLQKNIKKDIIKFIDKFSFEKVSNTFTKKDIPDIHLYTMYSLVTNLDDAEGPYNKEIVDFYYNNIVKIDNDNFKTLDKSYKFFYIISLGGTPMHFASKTDIINYKYSLEFSKIDYDMPIIADVYKFKELSYKYLANFYDFIDDPIDLIEKSLVKKYNIRYTTLPGSHVKHRYVYDIEGLGKNYVCNIAIAEASATIDSLLIYFKNSAEELPIIIKYVSEIKSEINSMLKNGFKIDSSITSCSLTAYGGILLSFITNTDYERVYFTYKNNLISIQYSTEPPFKTVDSFIDFYKNQ